MAVFYNEKKKNLPSDQLHRLFMSAGWVRGETPYSFENFNKPFINSTLVISAWENKRLIGAVRVISDRIIRSVIYDLVIDPEFQNRGIGKELVRRCIECFPDSEWLVGTEDKAAFYEKLGFRTGKDTFLTISSKWQK